ncbi:MAG: YfhO family protein [Candidatus Omnitrophica bacterium]|nr:YfhO family protein [Candidatus Omnitrophota bacterium]
MIGILLAALAIFFYKFVFLGMVPLNADWLVDNFYPWKGIAHAASAAPFNNDTDPVLYMYPIKFVTIQFMKQGIMPLWNPYIMCGTPLWGNNFATPLNPLNIVFFLFSFVKAWGIFLMCQFAVAGIGMYFYSRQIGSGRPGALVAALAYMLNMTFVIQFQTLSYLGVFSWLPLALLLIEKALARKSVSAAFWCGLSFALFFWSGQIQLAVYASAMALVYLVFRSIQSAVSDRKGSGRYATIALIIITVAVLYALPELIVQKINIANSTRTAGRYGLSLLYPQMLISYISPFFYGIQYDGWDLGFGTYIFNRGFMRLSPPYVGIITLFLAAVGFLARKRHDRFFYLFFSGGILIALMSFALPFVYKPVIKLMPYFQSVDHYRLTTLYAFSVAVMAGWGCDGLLRDDGKKFVKIAVIALALLISLFGCLEILSRVNMVSAKSFLAAAEKALPGALFDGTHSLKSLSAFTQYLATLRSAYGSLLASDEARVPLGLALVSFLAIAALAVSKRKAVFTGVVVIVLAVDLLMHGLVFPAYSRASNAYPVTNAARFLSADRGLFRIVGFSERTSSPRGDMYPPNTAMPYGLYDVRGYENLGQARWYYRFIMGDEPDEIVIERFNDYNSKFLPFLNVKYLVSEKEITADRWELVYDKEVKIYGNAGAMPRAFITGNVRVAPDSEAAYGMIREDSFDPAREAVVERVHGVALEKVAGSGISYPDILSYGPNEVVVETEGDEEGVLVLSDTYFPGWRAFVDGKERPVLKADYAFRAVQVRAGDKRVRFIFKPKGLYELLYICAALMALMLAVSLRRIFAARPLR